MRHSLVTFSKVGLLKILISGLESNCCLLRTRSPAYNMNISSYSRTNCEDGTRTGEH